MDSCWMVSQIIHIPYHRAYYNYMLFLVTRRRHCRQGLADLNPKHTIWADRKPPNCWRDLVNRTTREGRSSINILLYHTGSIDASQMFYGFLFNDYFTVYLPTFVSPIALPGSSRRHKQSIKNPISQQAYKPELLI